MEPKFNYSEEIALKYWGKRNEVTYKEIVGRVVGHIYKDELAKDPDFAEAQQMFGLLYHKVLMPNSPVFMNAGTELTSLAACFVLPIEDDMSSIFGAAKDMALIMKAGGGVGLSLSRLRPGGSDVKSTKGVSSGPTSFLKVYDSVVDTVKQGGTREL